MSTPVPIISEERPLRVVFSKGERREPSQLLPVMTKAQAEAYNECLDRHDRGLHREEVQHVDRATVRESFGGRVWPPEVWDLVAKELP